MILVDSNVLLDLVTRDPAWIEWSQRKLDGARGSPGLAINDVVYAEVSIGFDDMVTLDAMIADTGLQHLPVPRHALFLAGKAFREYRKARGSRTGVLPDFFIGAHAVAADMPLLTRDARRFRTYFPSLRLIAPD